MDLFWLATAILLLIVVGYEYSLYSIMNTAYTAACNKPTPTNVAPAGCGSCQPGYSPCSNNPMICVKRTNQSVASYPRTC